MTSSSDYELIHGQLYVTKDESQPELLGLGTKVIRGATYMQSPTLVGNDTTFENIEAPFMIGPIKNTDSQIPWICDPDIKFIEQWEVSPCGSTGNGAEKYGEKLAHPYSLVVRAGDHITKDKKCKETYKKRPEGPPSKAGDEEFVITPSEAAAMFIGDVDIYGYTRIKDKLSVIEKADFNSDVVIKGDVVTGSNITLGGTLNASGEVKSNCGGHVLSAKKNFDIPHPTKEGWRLTHTCVEGPEASVYIRGRVRNKTEISLPEYWKNLVDINTITVNLTPIGSHQDVIIKRWDFEKVYLQAKAGIPIDCFYYIMAERKDTEKLIPEYEGLIEDYPGDNSQRSIAGYHYDVKDA
jgi:hypothetical protein